MITGETGNSMQRNRRPQYQEFVVGIEEVPCQVRRLMLPMRVEANEGPSTFVFSSSRAVRINTVLILPALSPQDDAMERIPNVR
jgi:hypothetical protein